MLDKSITTAANLPRPILIALIIENRNELTYATTHRDNASLLYNFGFARRVPTYHLQKTLVYNVTSRRNDTVMGLPRLKLRVLVDRDALWSRYR